MSQQMPLYADQQQVSRASSRRGQDALLQWAKKSVWSWVCAMDLGIVSESPLKASPSSRTWTSVANRSPLNSPLQFSVKKPSRRRSRKLTNDKRRKKKRALRIVAAANASRVNVYGNWKDHELDRADNSTTVERYWKSRKRKPGGSKKPENLDSADPDPDPDKSRTIRALASDQPANVHLPPPIDCQVYPAAKRTRAKSETFPSPLNHFRAGSLSPTPIERPPQPLPAAREAPRRSSRNRVSRNRPSRKKSWTDRVELETFEAEEQTLSDVCEERNESQSEGRSWRKSEEGSSSSPSNRDRSSTSGETESDRASKRSPEDKRRPIASPKSRSTERDSHAAPSSTKRVSGKGRSVSEGEGEGEQNDASGKTGKASCNGSASTKEETKKEKKGETKSDLLRNKMIIRDEWYQNGRRVTRGSVKIGKELNAGQLVWGNCSGWWPALIVDAEHVGMLSEAGKLWVYWIGESRISLLNEKTQIEAFSSNLSARLTHNTSGPRGRAIDATMQMLRKILGCALTKPYATWIENTFSDTIEILDEARFYPYPPKVQQRLDYLKEKNAKVTERYLLDQKRESQGKKAVEKPKDPPQRNKVEDSTRLPLKEQSPGSIAWAKISGHNWWPAMIIDYRDCCMREPSFGCQWIMWYGDYQLSEVHHQSFLRFDKGIEKMREYTSTTKKHGYLVGVLQACKDYCSRLGLETENWTLDHAFEYFSKAGNGQASQDSPKKGDSAKIYDKYSDHMVRKLNELKSNPNVDNERADHINSSADLRSALSGNIPIESLCLKCLKVTNGSTEIHPFFEGSLCKDCSEQYKPRMFVYGNDAKCFYCTVCAANGTMIICDKEDCPRVYCTACMKHLLCPRSFDKLLYEDPWECLLCTSKTRAAFETIVRPRANWKDKIVNMFRTNCNSSVQQPRCSQEKSKIRVLSLFDGLSTGLLVLRKLGLNVDVYYASEIDPDALMVSATHFGDQIVHLGNVKDITREMLKEIAPIDLLIGGSPCNDLSLANPARLGLHDPNGTGVLFFEYCRILKLMRKLNNGRHLFWMYENVASMPTEYRLEINKHLGQEPDAIDSADFSPQHRLRLYWHNLPIEPHSLIFQGEQDLQDILTPHCQRYALVKKIRTVTTKVNSLKQGKLALKPILMKDKSDTLWITELEEIFGFPRHYTDVKNLSATKRQRLIGKSWSVQTLTAILGSLCPLFECNTSEPS